MENFLKIVQQLGLNEKQAHEYMACLELGSATVAELAKKSGVKRTSIYNFMEDLVSRGFLSEVTRGDQAMFVAENPQALLKKAQEQLTNTQEALPQLLALFNLAGNKPKVHFYQGIDGLQKIYEATWASKEPIYAFSDYKKMMNLMEKWMWKYAEERTKRGIKFFCIAKDGPWAKKMVIKNVEHKREMKIVKEGTFDTEINIYENKVAMMSFQRPFAGVIIEDAAIAQTLKSIWQMLWTKLP